MSSGSTPWWRHGRHERFARATARWPDVTPSDEAHDPALAGELAVLTFLRHNAAAVAPTPDARARMRDRVLSALPTVLGTEPEAAPAPRPRPAPRRGTGTRGRLAIALGAAFCLVLALSGMTMLLSRNALPGDPLYGLRRTVESASLDLTIGDDTRGYKHLEYAADRIGDIETLAARYRNGATDPDSPVGDYLTAFADFDSDATAGAGDLTGYASQHGPGPLGTLRTWTNTQSIRIAGLIPKLPPEAAARAATSRALLARIDRRAAGLQARTACYSVTSGAIDDLGPLPAAGPCDHAPAASGVTPAPPPGTGAPAPRQPFTGVPATETGAGTGAITEADILPAEPAAAPMMFPAEPPAGLPPRPVPPSLPVTPPPAGVTIPLPFPLGEIPPLLPGLPVLQLGD